MKTVLRELFNLKKITLEQKKELYRDDIERYNSLDIEKKRVVNVLDTEIRKLMESKYFDDQLKDNLKKLFIEIYSIEKENNEILKTNLNNLIFDKQKINLNRKLHNIYNTNLSFNFDKTINPPMYDKKL